MNSGICWKAGKSGRSCLPVGYRSFTQPGQPCQFERSGFLFQSLSVDFLIGFQINGWYWRCGGASDCPNRKNCRNPDNAGQVGIKITPGQTATSCTAAELVKNFDIGTCDSSVPNASDVVTVTLEDPSACLIRVEVSDLTQLDPTDGCCSCDNCTTARRVSRPTAIKHSAIISR